MNNRSLQDSYNILLRIYRDGAFANEEMKSVTSKRTAKIVYGVLDKHYELNYIVDSLADSVKPVIKPLLLAGAYSLVFMDTPLNVVLNETGEILDEAGKSGVKKFCYAVLSKISRREYEYPKKSDKRYLEVKYNLPSFLVGMFRKDYPDDYERIISIRESPKIHIVKNVSADEEEIFAADRNAEKTLTGYFVNNNKEIAYLNYLGKITIISYPSSLAAESVVRKFGKGDVLDACAAPGGKSVYLAMKGLDVVSCDIYPHRLDLIKAYAKRMKVSLTTVLQDATEYNGDYEEKFDVVFADVPCSGLGVLTRRKDVVFNRTYEDIAALSELQSKIIDNVSRYVKKDGLLVYSTCTVFDMENGKVIRKFLESHEDFVRQKIDLPYDNDGEIQFLPDGKGMEGFYLCHLAKK